MDYGRHFTDSLTLTWRHKSWWLLGALLGVVILPQLALMRLLLTTAARASEMDEAAVAVMVGDALAWFIQPQSLALTFIVLLVFTAVVWLATAVAEGGIIWAANESQEGRPAPLTAAMGAGWRYLLRLVALDAVIFLPLFLLLLTGMFLGGGGMIGGIVLLAQEAATMEEALLLAAGGGGLFLCLSLLGIPLGAVSFLYRFVAFRAAIVEDLPPAASLRRAAQLFRQHWLTFVLVALLLWGARYAVRSVSGFIFTPLYMLNLRLALNEGNVWGALIGLTADLGNYLLYAILILFNAVAWTVFYRAVIAPEAETWT